MEITLTLDDVSQMTLSSEQALWGLECGVIYYCPDCSAYHNSPDTDPDAVVETLTLGASI